MDRPPTYADTIRLGAARSPDAVALICGDLSRTWSALWERSCRVAQGLLASSDRSGGRRIAFIGRNCIEFFEILYGASLAGAAPVGINWRLTPEEVMTVLNDAEPAFLFIDEEFVPLLGKIEAELLSVPQVIVIGVDGAEPTNAGEYLTIESWLAAQESHDPQPETRPDDIAVLTYTSGTTGLPKAAMHSVAAIAASFALAEALEISGDTVALIATPIFHATAAGAVAMVLSAGGHCVIARDSAPITLAQLIARHEITMTILVPTIVKAILESPDVHALDLSSLRTLVYTASPISPTLLRNAIERLPAVRFVQVYGSTECLGATVLRPEEHQTHATTAGRPMPGVTLRIVDVLTGEPVDDGLPGEVWVRSPTIMSGYWHQPDETKHAITPDGFVRTGDIGLLRNGFLTLIDRAKDMIVSGGENIFPVEVENVLNSHPAVSEAAVIGVPSERWGETVLAFVVAAPDERVDEAALIAYTRGRLASYKCPTSVRIVAALPRNASGKVLKTVLREPFWHGHARRIG